MSSYVISDYKNVLLNISRDCDIRDLKNQLRIYDNLELTNFLIDYIYEEVNSTSCLKNTSEKKSIEKSYDFILKILDAHNFDCNDITIKLKKLRLLIEDNMLEITREEDGSLIVCKNNDTDFWSSIDAFNSKIIRICKNKKDHKFNSLEFEKTLDDLIFKVQNVNLVECFIKTFSSKDIMNSSNYSKLLDKLLNNYMDILIKHNSNIKDIIYFDKIISIILSHNIFKIDHYKLDIISNAIKKISLVSFKDSELYNQRMIFLDHLKKKISNVENYVDSVCELNKKYNVNIKKNIDDEILSCFNNNYSYNDFTSKNVLICDSQGAICYDDGISIEMLENGNYIITSYVTDVGYHVDFNSVVDNSALNLGSNMYNDKAHGYLIKSMLPRKVITEKCSLIPGAVKNVLVCIMEFEPDGNLISHHFAMGKILPKKEFLLSFNDADFILQSGKRDTAAESTLHLLRRATSKIDYKGLIKDDASGIVRKIMSLTNKLLTNDAFKSGFPIIYRNYGEISCDEIMSHNSSLKSLEDFPLKNSLLSKIKGNIIDEAYRPFYSIYPNSSTKDKYAQMTSPIRRYADVMNGRMLKKGVSSNWNINNKEAYKIEELFKDIADHLNTCEIISNQYLNDYAKIKK